MPEREAILEALMYLKILLTLLPLIPTLIKDIEDAITMLKQDSSAPAQAAAAKTALNDLHSVVDQIIAEVGPPKGIKNG